MTSGKRMVVDCIPSFAKSCVLQGLARNGVNISSTLTLSKSILKGNSLPILLIDRVNRSFLDHKFSGTGRRHIVENKPTHYFSTPILGPGSVQLISRISRAFVLLQHGFFNY